jgi:hypothetical protein
MTADVVSDLCSYLYGIVDAGFELPPDLVGVDDRAVRLLPAGPVAAVISDIDVSRPLTRREDLLAHGRVLDAVAAAGTVIPVRFGSVLEQASDIRANVLEPHADRLVATLDELRGRAQFVVHASYDEQQLLSEIVAESPQIAELSARTRGQPEDASYPDRVRLGTLVMRAVEAKREADGAQLISALRAHATAHNPRAVGGTDQLVDVAFLVDAGERPAFEQAAERVAADLAGRARVRLVGPTAPYDFVSDLE